jgi:hypothetical protein
MNEQDLVERLRKRAEIRRQIPTRKSVQENQPDRIADLLDEAAREIQMLRNVNEILMWRIDQETKTKANNHTQWSIDNFGSPNGA